MKDISASTDPLSGILSRLQTVAWRTGVATFAPYWGVSTPHGYISFYVAVKGDFQIALSENGQAPIAVPQGTYILLTHGTPHALFDQVGSPISSWSDVKSQSASRRLRLEEDSGCIVIHGHFPIASLGSNCFDTAFPSVVRFDTVANPLMARCEPLLELLIEEAREAREGWQAIIAEVVGTLFAQALRALILESRETSEQNRHGNWIDAALDATIGPVLATLHASPEKQWTVASLARQAHMAKSAFSERFRDTVGLPPLKYLTEFRIKKACQLLRDTDFGIKEIASAVGYESPSSFSNAFKRWVGQAPADYRKNGNSVDFASGTGVAAADPTKN